MTAVVVLVAGLGIGTYLWVQTVYLLPGASCGTVGGLIWARTRLLTGASRTPQCFLAVARTCASVGIRVHTQGTESSTDYVFIINAGGVPGRCRVTEYSQDQWYLGTGRVQVTGCREASVTSKASCSPALTCPGRA